MTFKQLNNLENVTQGAIHGSRVIDYEDIVGPRTVRYNLNQCFEAVPFEKGSSRRRRLVTGEVLLDNPSMPGSGFPAKPILVFMGGRALPVGGRACVYCTTLRLGGFGTAGFFVHSSSPSFELRAQIRNKFGPEQPYRS
jgi:hypothetical protein